MAFILRIAVEIFCMLPFQVLYAFGMPKHLLKCSESYLSQQGALCLERLLEATERMVLFSRDTPAGYTLCTTHDISQEERELYYAIAFKCTYWEFEERTAKTLQWCIPPDSDSFANILSEHWSII